MRISIILLVVCAAGSLLRADSLEFTVQTTDGGPPLSSTVKGTNLIDLTRHLVQQEKEFTPFVGRGYDATAKFPGVKDAIKFSSSPAGTSLTRQFPKTA